MSSALPKVLLVDDEPALGRALAFALYEYEIELVSDSRAALELLDSRSFDAVILDVQMPHVSGIQLYQKYVARWPDRAGRVVFMSGGIYSPEAEKFLAGLSNPRLEKPFGFEVLREAVRRVLEKGPQGP